MQAAEVVFEWQKQLAISPKERIEIVFPKIPFEKETSSDNKSKGEEKPLDILDRIDISKLKSLNQSYSMKRIKPSTLQKLSIVLISLCWQSNSIGGYAKRHLRREKWFSKLSKGRISLFHDLDAFSRGTAGKDKHEVQRIKNCEVGTGPYYRKFCYGDAEKGNTVTIANTTIDSIFLSY